MSIFKTNRDFDSTMIIIGIHVLMGAVLYMEYIGGEKSDLSSFLNNLIIVYGMIASYFFKSQSQNGNGSGNTKTGGQ